MEIPRHLLGNIAIGEQEGECIAQFEIGDYKNFVYLILDWKTRKAAILDPQYDLSSPLGCLKRHGFELVATFLTHTHFDHIAGLPTLIKTFPTIPIYVHREDQHRLEARILNHGRIKFIQDGDEVTVGSLKMKVLHTPGHSAGEVCYQLTGEFGTQRTYLFTGDTLFIRDCGRTDLPTGNTEAMFHSLQKIRKLSPNTVILPGHHYRPECSSTLEKELISSPPFQCKTVSELEMLP